tara:strand:+ start:11946 stop:12506 length:561 start_codon:yes stop_codon:yes gene_type:complete
MAKEKPHYVNNKEFSLKVVEHVRSVELAVSEGQVPPKVTDYIASCFMKISEGLSHRPNFVRYTYRDEMVMDAVENCLRAIKNYNIDTATRTGKPNAFSYFTQICYFAFIRRITKEKKQQDIKFRYIEKMGIEDFIQMGMDGETSEDTIAYVDTLRQRIDVIRDRDVKIKKFAKDEKDIEKLEFFMV